jgi:hypothetical protein
VTYSGSEKFKKKAVSNYTVNGVVGGTYKTEGNLSWLRVFGSGHFVPYFRKSLLEGEMRFANLTTEPKLALQAFKQNMQRRPINST